MTQSLALGHRGSGISGRSMVTRALLKDGVSLPRLEVAALPHFRNKGRG